MRAAEAAFGSPFAIFAIDGRLERLGGRTRIGIPGDTVIVPFETSEDRLVVAVSEAGLIPVGEAAVTVNGHPFLADEIGVGRAVFDLGHGHLAAVVHDAGLTEAEVVVGGRIAGWLTDVGASPAAVFDGGVAVGSIEAVAGEEA